MMKKSFAVIIIAAFLILSFVADASASDGPDADDTITGDRAGCFTIKFTDEFFEANSEFFTEDKFPMKVCAVDTTNADNKTMISIEQASACDALIRPSSGEEFWLIIEDYRDEHGQTLYITNAESDPSISYAPDSFGTAVYTASHLTSALERSAVLDTDLGQTKVSFYSPAGVFEHGSTFFADALSGAGADTLKAVIDEEYLEELEGIFMFDVGVRNKYGERYTELSDKVKLSVSLPDGWEDMDIKFIYPTDEADVELTGEIKTISGGNMYETELEHFGSYALLVYKKPKVPEKKSTRTSDLGGSTLDGKTGKFSLLQLKSTKQTKSSVKIAWKKVSGAKKYVVYGNKCGRKNKMKKLLETTGKSVNFKKILGKKVKKGTYYKFVVVALDKNNKVVTASKSIHVATKGGKVGNNTKVKLSKKKLTLKKGKSKKIKAALKKGSLKVSIHRKVAWESSDPKVATVTKKGKIKAVKKGTCYIYAYAQNGLSAKCKVTVK